MQSTYFFTSLRWDYNILILYKFNVVLFRQSSYPWGGEWVDPLEDILALEPVVECCTNVSWQEVLECLTCPLVSLERPLCNLSYRVLLTGDSVPKERQTLTAEVAHGDTGNGHEPHEEV